MPEWPELRVMQERIAAALVGKKVVAVRVGDPVVLRAEKPVDELLVGRTLRSIRHHGKFLIFAFDGLDMTVNPMLAGIFTLQPAGTKATKDTRIRVEFEGGTELSEATFSERAKAKRSEVRNLLQDQTFVSGIGNAYADEILWDAKLHPKRRVGSLTPDEMHRFFGSLRSVIAEGLAQVRTAMPPQLGEKPRAHMQVRGRAGKACPRCGTVLMRRRKGLDDVDLCPKCQPAPKGQLY